MTIDPERLMAYADGELDPLEAKRVERAIAADPALAAEVADHRALRDRLATGFAPVAAEPVPDRLAALVRPAVVPLRRDRPARARWPLATALAASLVLGLSLGRLLPGEDVTAQSGALYAAGSLATGLDTARAGRDAGAVRVALSFRDRSGSYCRVFAAATTDGIACRDDRGWALRRTQAGSATRAASDYAQAGSADADLMAAAQDMMAGDPLDAAQEAAAEEAGWHRGRFH